MSVTRHITCPNCGAKVKQYSNPKPTVDVIIRYGGCVVLIERTQHPLGWALPGGFIDYGEKVEDAAHREMKEETNLDLENLELFSVQSDPDRDPRHHTITIVYTADGVGELKAGDDAGDARVFTADTLPEKIAFDHREVLQDYFVHHALDS